jgi:ABC-type phosphate/phosphonate transport system substrate-binding protein
LTALSGQVIGFGAVDSPQANLIPRDYLRRRGFFPNRDYTARRFDELSGKHGDHIGGERDAAVALMKGEIDAAWMIDSNYLAFSREGILPAGVTRIVARSGNYDHCNFTVISGLSSVTDEMAVHFTELLLAMRWQDSQVRPLLELEGLKEWFPGRTSGYELLIRSVDDEKFYDAEGNILVADYRY